MRIVMAFTALVLASAAPASAEWYQASSQHFVIYSEQKPAILRQFADKLERFDAAVRLIRGMAQQPASKGNRLTIFELRSDTQVQQLYGNKSKFVSGFYRGQASGSIAFTSRPDAHAEKTTETGSIIAKSSEWDMHDDTVLLHEYSHHLMMQDLNSPLPQWLVEGFAEFMSAAKFERDGSVGLGLPANHRYAGLIYGEQLPLETLLADKYDKLNVEQEESVYGKGWLLTHYLTFEDSRRGQLSAFVAALAKGVEPLTAARQAFGDLKTLAQDLETYFNRAKLDYLKIKGDVLKVGPIEVTRLGPGGSAVLPLLVQVENGVSKEARPGLAAQLRAVEQANPGDPLVETTLAEAELDASDFAAAEAAADRAMAANPASSDAMILKGRAEIEKLAKSGGTTQQFADARAWLLKANKIDPEDPEPLYEFYESYGRQGIAPTRNAIEALHYASDLAPQDAGLRLTSAGLFLIDKAPKDARATLVPVAYDPHGGEAATMARRMIERIDAGDGEGALKLAGWTFSAGS